MDEETVCSVESQSEVVRAAISFEAQKYGLRQSREAVILSLRLHPNDVPAEIFATPVNGRYFVSIVEIGDDERPVVPESRLIGQRFVQSAGMLCREIEFQKWVAKRTGWTVNERNAAEYVRVKCGIISRADLARNRLAQAVFKAIRAAFEAGTWV